VVAPLWPFADRMCREAYFALNALATGIAMFPLLVENGYPGANRCWLRLIRMGNTFVAHSSTSGTN
jgi:hypothetical protein